MSCRLNAASSIVMVQISIRRQHGRRMPCFIARSRGRHLGTGLWQWRHVSSPGEQPGYHVRSTDLYDHGYGEHGVNFLLTSYTTDNIVTNPPYHLAEDFVHAGLILARRKLALLMSGLPSWKGRGDGSRCSHNDSHLASMFQRAASRSTQPAPRGLVAARRLMPGSFGQYPARGLDDVPTLGSPRLPSKIRRLTMTNDACLEGRDVERSWLLASILSTLNVFSERLTLPR